MSTLEAMLLYQLKALGLPTPLTNYRFHPRRKWEFDLSWPGMMIAAEVEGGTWINGRHVLGSGYEKDCQKYNAATLLGWRVFRFTSGMVKSGEAFETLEKVFDESSQPAREG
jgi:hypothetical protein